MATIDKELGQTVANSFRLGFEAEANEKFTAFIDNITTNLTEKELYKKPQLQNIFTEIFDAQKKRDILRLADTIEYQLLPEI